MAVYTVWAAGAGSKPSAVLQTHIFRKTSEQGAELVQDPLPCHICTVHCPKNYQNLRIKTEPITVIGQTQR